MSAYRILTLVERVTRRDRALLPPAHLRFYYYRTSNPEAYWRASANARTVVTTFGLRPEHRLLDIGSGIGNLALGLIDYLRGGYDGVEIHAEAVTWCQRSITPRHPHFHFHRADVSSVAYNPGGPTPASLYRFPFPDGSFDFVFLGSVFTHMLPDAFERYAHEIARMLAPDGICVASYFLLNDDTRAAIERGDSFMSFSVTDASGLCRLHDRAVPEAAVALDEPFVRRVLADAGLRIQEVHRGRWWRGEPDFQDVLVVTPDRM